MVGALDHSGKFDAASIAFTKSELVIDGKKLDISTRIENRESLCTCAFLTIDEPAQNAVAIRLTGNFEIRVVSSHPSIGLSSTAGW